MVRKNDGASKPLAGLKGKTSYLLHVVAMLDDLERRTLELGPEFDYVEEMLEDVGDLYLGRLESRFGLEAPREALKEADGLVEEDPDRAADLVSQAQGWLIEAFGEILSAADERIQANDERASR
ncbi:MAG TPA: hypothetical protein VKD72_12885 [Gemmataceae bacterium]|nr:hypothetical protein [Gemmataceae bacterium]